MGCKEVNDPTANLPTLICTFEPKNQAQKQYCIKLKDNFNYPTSVKYEIKAYAGSTFNIMLVIQGKNHSIQTTLNESDENEVKNNLQKIYDIHILILCLILPKAQFLRRILISCLIQILML